MPKQDYELNPVTHITVDAIGEPGSRVFYLQGKTEGTVVTVIIEKIQLTTLAGNVEQFLDEINERHPELEEASPKYEEKNMHIKPPVDPLFRVGDMGLIYDDESDMVCIITKEMQLLENEDQKSNIARFWCSRSQLYALAKWGEKLASRGRPICPQCGQPEEPDGHFCPKKNGRKHRLSID